MITYGNYVCIKPATEYEIERAQEQMRHEAFQLLRAMDQSLEKMDDVQIIVHRRDEVATVGWKVAI